MRRALVIAALVIGYQCLATDATINQRADGLWLTLSNLPPHWAIQSTLDLTNWHTQVTGSVRTNGYVEFILRPDDDARFFRVLPLTPP